MGGNRLAGLAVLNDTLYGTTISGGSSGSGTVFSVDPNTGAEAVVYSFTGQPRLTNGTMIDVGGMLYGTTAGAGSLSFGTLFQFNPATGQQTTLYTFKRRRGRWQSECNARFQSGRAVWNDVRRTGFGQQRHGFQVRCVDDYIDDAVQVQRRRGRWHALQRAASVERLFIRDHGIWRCEWPRNRVHGQSRVRGGDGCLCLHRCGRRWQSSRRLTNVGGHCMARPRWAVSAARPITRTASCSSLIHLPAWKRRFTRFRRRRGKPAVFGAHLGKRLPVWRNV